MEKKRVKFINLKLFQITIIIYAILYTSIYSFDHSHNGYDLILKKYVKNGLVNYKGIKSEEAKLDTYLKELSSVTNNEYQKFNREEKLAFFINAYNAFTIKLILDNYPLKSIRSIGYLPGAAWRTEFFILLEKKRTLDWIEHSNLRVDFNEPRIHFAIVCASKGCPILNSEAFIPTKLDSQLQSSLSQFLSDSVKNRYDEKSNTLYLSKIFDWFKEDFTKKTTIIDFINIYTKKNIPQNAKIEYTEYDWNLNELQ